MNQYDVVLNRTSSDITRLSADLSLEILRLEGKKKALEMVIRNRPDLGGLHLHNEEVELRRWAEKVGEDLDAARRRARALDAIDRELCEHGIAEHPLHPGEPLPQGDLEVEPANEEPRRRLRLR